MTLPFRITQLAQQDISEILTWSAERFGEEASDRYLALIEAGIKDIADNPERIGSHDRPELGHEARTWHLGLSREHSALPPVYQPRHFLICRAVNDVVVIRRVLHDSMELSRHLDPDQPDRSSRR